MSIAGTSETAGPRPSLALIAGPTASGKSDLAVRLALEHGNATVINADSAQVYRDLCVLSARPSDEAMRGVPHRLFGTWDGAETCSAADWAAAAKREIENAHANDRLPILVGGTGMYIRTLLEGIAPVPEIDPLIRVSVREMPQPERRAALEREDAEAAARLAPADAIRTARALEVVRSTGRPLAAWQQERSGGIGRGVALAPLILLPDRAELYRRCDVRFAAMFDGGAIGEVEALLARGLDPAVPVMRAIGVREVASFIRGDVDRATALATGQQATRNYAKRQYTWLRHQPPPDWRRSAPENVDMIAHFASLFQH